MTLNKHILFTDDTTRMNKRVVEKENKLFPQILELIQTCPIKNEDYLQIKSFFSKNSLANLPECEQIIDNLIGYINNPNLALCSHGVRCLYFILCQKTFQFEPKFTSVLCENLQHLIRSPDRIILYYFLNILDYIAKISPEYAQMAKEIVPLEILNNIIITSEHKKVTFSAMNFFKNYIITDANDKDVRSSLCEVSTELIKNNEDDIDVLIETVKLCSFYAQKSECWVTFFQPYNLFDVILSMFSIDSVPLRIYILRLISCSFKHTQTIDNIDFPTIIQLINHDDSDLQKSSIWCINKCLIRNPNYLQRFIEVELFENLFHCIQNGSFKARIACISLFETILNIDKDNAAIYLSQNLLAILMELISEITDGFELDKIFRIIQKMVKCVEGLREKDAYQELINQFMNANLEEVYEDFMERSQTVTNKLSQELLSSPHLVESFQLIMRSVNDMGATLESL